MADALFRDAQLSQAFAPQVREVNQLCDALMAEKPDSTVPYIAPHHNAANARILSLYSNPGPARRPSPQPGFLSGENDDPSAERMSQIYTTVGLSDADVMPWNSYPWNVHESYPNGLPPQLVVDGLGPLKRMLELHPKIRAVVAHGSDAQRSMKLLATKKRFAEFSSARSLVVWQARHPANRVFILPSPDRAAAIERVCASYREAMESVGVAPLPAAGRTAAVKQVRATRRAAATRALSGADLVSEVGDVLSGRTDGLTATQTRNAVRAYLASMSPRRRTDLLVELVAQRLDS
ncbi:hypothetical protein B0I08_101633 [Glaciihabitans tibetensis]|uniref:Uracil DNA glycosylase superfamily protein n=2 Tax=Glaciihabitans tibetensis TaxID=1266600 RepID=A0A2T0VJV1_9MICO|nr:hypothetical protein B0I08_101633 [Glaciihabitans tibetensis]